MYVYILFSLKLNKFYTGQTNDPKRRLIEHNMGHEKFTKNGVPWSLVWTKECSDRLEATQLEKKIKKRGAKRYLEDI